MPSPRHAYNGPKSAWLLSLIGRAWLRFFGWQIEGELPADAKAVFIAAPHTSNWDLPFTLAVAWVYRVKLSWLGKHTLFRFPYGPIMRWLGGLPVDRRARGNVVAQAQQRFDEHERIFLAVAPSGTRKRVEFWRSGFYHIASAASVPIVCGFLDYARRRGGVGPALLPTGDLAADMDRVRAFYTGIRGRHPTQESGIRLREEALPDQETPLAS